MAKNPTNWLSFDQRCEKAASVPGSASTDPARREWTHRRSLPSSSVATNASQRPSGETAKGPEVGFAKLSVVFSGAGIQERVWGTEGLWSLSGSELPTAALSTKSSLKEPATPHPYPPHPPA